MAGSRRLQIQNMIYLASPYWHPSPAICDQRYVAACRATVRLLLAIPCFHRSFMGIRWWALVFHPICHFGGGTTKPTFAIAIRFWFYP